MLALEGLGNIRVQDVRRITSGLPRAKVWLKPRQRTPTDSTLPLDRRDLTITGSVNRPFNMGIKLMDERLQLQPVCD